MSLAHTHTHPTEYLRSCPGKTATYSNKKTNPVGINILFTHKLDLWVGGWVCVCGDFGAFCKLVRAFVLVMLFGRMILHNNKIPGAFRAVTRRGTSQASIASSTSCISDALGRKLCMGVL